MHFWSLLSDIGILLSASLLLGAIAIKLRLSPLIGYLLAGAFLGGPGSFHLVQSPTEIEAIAELGVSLLLFSLGLEFSWEKIKSFPLRVFKGGLLQIILTPISIFAIAFFLHLDLKLAIFFSLILTLSSTATVLRTLVDLAEIESPHGRNAAAVLLLQDMAVIPFTIIISFLVSSGEANSLENLLFILAGVLVLILSLYLVLNKAALPVFSLFTLESNREMSILLATIMSIGSAWAAHQIGISPAIGAFIAGMMLGSSPFATQITADVSPLRIIFLTLFFGSVGIVANPIWIMHNIGFVLAITFSIIAFKTIVSFAIFKLCKNTIAISLASALSISQIGEFAFVLASIAKEGNLISDELHQIIFSVTIMSILFTTFLIKESPKISLWIQKLFTKKEIHILDSLTPEEAQSQSIFIIGYGPSGNEVARQLKENSHDNISILDLNKDSINKAITEGFKGYVGDTRQMDVLRHHGLSKAKLVVITIPSYEASLRTIDIIKKLAPNAFILVRSKYQIHEQGFKQAGAHQIINEELSVGKALGEAALKQLPSSSEN